MMLTAARLASQVRTSGEAKRSGIPTAKRLANLITISGVNLSIVMPPARESAEQESHSGGKRKRNLMIVTDCALHVVWTGSCSPSKRLVSATFEEIVAEQCKPKASCSSILQDVFYSACFCGIYSAQHASMMLSVIRAGKDDKHSQFVRQDQKPRMDKVAGPQTVSTHSRYHGNLQGIFWARRPFSRFRIRSRWSGCVTFPVQVSCVRDLPALTTFLAGVMMPARQLPDTPSVCFDLQ